MNTKKKTVWICVLVLVLGSLLAATDQVKANLLRYYQDVLNWMSSPAYLGMINDYDKITAKQDQLAEKNGFADLDKITEAEEKYAEDDAVIAANEKITELSKKLRAQNNKTNTGKITVTYNITKKKAFKEILTIVKESELLKFLADHVQSLLYLPVNLTISLEECKEENAFYDPDEKKIIICYEMVNYYKKYLEDSGEDIEKLVDLVMFDALHEFGHALIDIYDLPITGKEEDVADQIATWLILETIGENDTESIESALNAAYWFSTQFDKDNVAVEDLPFWDNHSLDPQRYHNIICWAYGYDPELTTEILGDNLDELLPEDRRGSCEYEYYKMSYSFTRFLDRYLKE